MKTKKHCIGCQNNIYNQQDFGMNMKNGKPICWYLESAIMVKAMDIPTWMTPPYKIPPISRPSCYKANGYCRIKTTALDRDGFWR